MNEEEQQKKNNYITQLVTNARAVISNQIEIPRGCLKANKIIHWLRPLDGPSYPIFEEYMEATSDLPIGDERLHWNAERLKAQDIKLEKLNNKFRKKIMEACQDIIQQYGGENN
ncbi:MAG: DUF2489 domain-containing protein [Nitrospinales bacterium]